MLSTEECEGVTPELTKRNVRGQEVELCRAGVEQVHCQVGVLRCALPPGQMRASTVGEVLWLSGVICTQ